VYFVYLDALGDMESGDIVRICGYVAGWIELTNASGGKVRARVLVGNFPGPTS